MAAIVPEAVAAAGGRIAEFQGQLFAEEEVTIRRSVPVRSQAFRAGRTCARRALAELGATCVAIPVAKDRSPVWPDGFLGSITHTGDLCAAIAAKTTSYIGLGLDLEASDALDAHLIPMVCRSDELGVSDPSLPYGAVPFDLPKLVFVVKEAVFKAYYPATRCFLDFKDVRVAIDRRTRTFSARIVNSARPAVAGTRSIAGRWTTVEGHFLAVAAVPCVDGAPDRLP
jgi:4'-phosphopantetheinyl transferase EntD